MKAVLAPQAALSTNQSFHRLHDLLRGDDPRLPLSIQDGFTGRIQTFAYSYDFGDGWDHRITVEKHLPVQEGRNDWPMCLAGENACPPEDVGGPPGYMNFLQAMRDPNHEQHADYWRWWGGPFDQNTFSINAANMAIRKLH